MSVLLCLIVAGCTTVSPGEANPASTSAVSTTDSSSSTSGDGLPSNGAPKVNNPLEVSRFEQDPCSILTAAQAGGLSLSASGKEEDGALGLDCKWRNEDSNSQVAIGFYTNDPRGLSGSYAANEEGKYAYFKPLPPIEGYPAITTNRTDRRADGICFIEVGVSDQLSFHVDLQLSQINVGTRDPCETASIVAGKALQTMKGT